MRGCLLPGFGTRRIRLNPVARLHHPIGYQICCATYPLVTLPLRPPLDIVRGASASTSRRTGSHPSDKMRAQVLQKFNEPYVFKDIAKPSDPEGQDILVEVQAASYCHTDAVFAQGTMWKDLPRVGSHEFAGRIVSLGPDVNPTLGLKEGQAIGVPGRAYRPCGECYECRNNDGDPEGYGVWCTKAGNLGLSRNGGFEEFALADSRQVAPIPDGLTALDTAPLMCAGVTIWSALEVAGVDVTDKSKNAAKSIAIIGAGGGLGHLGVSSRSQLRSFACSLMMS